LLGNAIISSIRYADSRKPESAVDLLYIVLALGEERKVNKASILT
jgi:hypothetical protein